MQKTQETRSLGQEDSLKEEMATHFSTLAGRTPWTEEPGGLYGPWGHKDLDMAEVTWHVCMDCIMNYSKWHKITVDSLGEEPGWGTVGIIHVCSILSAASGWED